MNTTLKVHFTKTTENSTTRENDVKMTGIRFVLVVDGSAYRKITHVR